MKILSLFIPFSLNFIKENKSSSSCCFCDSQQIEINKNERVLSNFKKKSES